MKTKFAAVLLLALVPGFGCAGEAPAFEMTVEEIFELNGMVLKGIYLGGKVKSGCIANTDPYVIKRDGKVVLETIGRIFGVVDKIDPESAVKGEYVKLYIPDVKAQDFKIGDALSSDKTSCK